MPIEFKVISSPRQDRFEELMSRALTDGWTMAGNVFVANTGAMTVAVTMEVKELPKKEVKAAPEKPKGKTYAYGTKPSEDAEVSE